MLALSRKQGESIVIGNNIEITVLEAKGDQVKIGISAPKSVPVYRKEIYARFAFFSVRGNVPTGTTLIFGVTLIFDLNRFLIV